MVGECLLHQLVLHDLVFDAFGTKHVAKLGDLFDLHPGEIQEDGRAHAIEAITDSLDCFGFLSAFHQSSSSFDTTVEVSMRTPGLIVLLSVMLRM